MWDGRQLTAYAKDDIAITYTYNGDGLRTSKTVAKLGTFIINGIETPYIIETAKTEYFYVNGQLHYQKTITSDTNGNKLSGKSVYFYYDSNGYLTGIEYNGNNFYTATNLRGDVVAIYLSTGECFAKYEYDAWGNVIAVTDANGNPITDENHIANVNPIRYRGYYYDTETGLYYVSSRYYDPEIGRFINADGAYDTNQGVLGYNMYAYCLNNPVNMYDPDGRCSRFLGFLWKIDCKQASCPESKNYVKPKAVDPIGSYNKGQGYVYIVKEDLLDEIMEDKEDNVVVVLDNRTTSDPNMQIQDSYRITKTKQQKEIAQIMLDYNTSNPVEPAWSRTLDSLVEEWELHNFAYSWGIKRNRTADCDFNNADEGMGFWDFVGR